MATPLSYREVVGGSRAIIITAFATGKVLIVIPLVIETARELLERQEIGTDKSAETVEAIVPLAYPFPHLGRILALLFIPFSAWFVGQPMSLAEYPRFVATGYLSMFGSTVVGIPYLLDAQQLPADLFQLFLASGVICGRLSDAAGAMHLFAMALITPAILSQQTRFLSARLVLFSAVSVIMISGVLFGSRAYLASTLAGLEKQADVLAQMHSPMTQHPDTVHRTVPAKSETELRYSSRLDRMRETKVVRVGYHPDNLPFSFFNASGELVGFDVDMAHLMADDLGMQLEFVPFEFDTLAEQLDRGDFDIAMSGIAITPPRLLRMSMTESYFDSTLAFVVKDHLRRKFSTRKSLTELTDISVAVPHSTYLKSGVEKYLPHAQVVAVASPREFFQRGDVDAMLLSAEAGSAWTIQFPSYAVAIPQPDVISHPLGYAVSQGDTQFTEFVNRWIELQRGHREYDRLYNHWILGKDAKNSRPRWCIIRDVLHWVD